MDAVFEAYDKIISRVKSINDEIEDLERTIRKEQAEKVLEITGLGIVYAPKPARIERPCNTQGIEKRPQNCVP